MPKRPEFSPFQRADKWIVSIPPAMSATGKRVRKTFVTKKDAERYAGKLRAAHNSGMRSGMISAMLANEAQEASRILQGTGISLLEAARQAAARLNDLSEKTLFKHRYDQAMLDGELHWSIRYSMDMRKLTRWLPDWFMDTPCGLIDRSIVEKALVDGHDLSRSTIDNRARMVLAVRDFRQKHRKKSSIQILTDDECTAMFKACENEDERRTVALLLYAGVRPDSEMGEIARIKWEDVGADYITIQPETSKTGSDRIIPIAPRLMRELSGRPAAGPVAPAGWKKRWQRIRKNAAIKGQDVTRHTFASHYLAWKGEDETKSVMGHTAHSTTLFRHYRRAVTMSDGEDYFA